MTVTAFIGPAGTGKTTRLIGELEKRLLQLQLQQGQRVLAVTRMHGSRARLTERLQRSSAKARFDCFTFDRLAWQVVNRWRSLLLESGKQVPGDLAYDEVCELAGFLLHKAEVADWTAAKYPVILVDEFQDCRLGRFEIVAALAQRADLLVAADDFQSLDATGSSETVSWLRAQGLVHELSTVHRTSKDGLLAAAHAVRSGAPPIKGAGFNVLSAPQANVAALFLANGIRWAGKAGVVVISATNPSKSPFVREALARLALKPFADKRTKKEFGPYTVDWELSQDDLEGRILGRLRPEHGNSIPSDGSAFEDGGRLPGQKDVEQWLANRRRIDGKASCSRDELRNAISRAVQHMRSHQTQQVGRRALTIHQGKNREFDHVLVLWPVTMKADLDLQRRLLYNAITRARHNATVVVQDPKRDSLKSPPFSEIVAL